VDTTCGSVLNVWKNVKRYAADGFTSVIHGKYWHEETRATASQASHGGEGHYLVVLNREEAAVACRYICGGAAADPPERSRGSAARSSRASSTPSRRLRPGPAPAAHRCANQTTMLSSESLDIGEMFRAAMRERYGEAGAATRFRAFDTICSATQDRQDAVAALLDAQPMD